MADNEKGEIILDGHKIEWHRDRLEAWLRGERIAPVTIDMALTRSCNYDCIYCYAPLQENPRKPLTKKVLHRFLDDASEIGVRGVSLMSDGESQCSPHFYDTITYGKSKGIDMAVATNGSLIKPERLEEILPCLTWFRYNISAADPARYQEIHGSKPGDYERVIENIRESVRLKKEKGFDVTIGMQMVLLPSFKDQIVPLAQLGGELGVDYLVIKHCSDDEKGSLGVPYKEYFAPDLIAEIEKAEALSRPGYKVQAKWSKILSGGKRCYSRCYGPPFLIQLSGSGLVAPCGPLFHTDYEKYHIGNIADTPFKEIWQSDRYWEVMNAIRSDPFDARTDCGTLCCPHKINEYLWDLQTGKIQLRNPSGKPPQHINFI